ncbi:response regulator transcription factor [Segniliparus rugosus]|uniref:DNA-binding response regulator n=1 Tax=Segniliparus rugosus (strain ATCC BAA-974 / DSM 45345 / CCUG 50838 / CIP 108380 / JCM 13579 / CDC 945) TaxID=679197 RepID=E5XV81_SEGRC|nr:response regulator transcription factor [Segniliparus rugosus]EFV11786.1 hypothetical protein HMPREF9336_03403 [Segniliparus rugosus ATCC BAA-974]
MENTPTSSPTVLVVDDDPDVLSSLQRGLRLSGFSVVTADNGAAALSAVHQQHPDALILDMNMPGLDGVSVVTALRAMGDDIPICVLSARSSVGDRIEGLEAGADDYLTKPFVLGELVARVKALLRRPSTTNRPAPTVEFGVIHVDYLSVDIPGRRVTVDDEPVELTKREFELLAALAENTGVVLSRTELLERVWGYDFAADTNVVDVFVGYLRKKLELKGRHRLIHTVRGYGFVLRAGQ